MAPTIAILPEPTEAFAAAVEAGGGTVGALGDADGVIWLDPGPLPDDLPDRVRWIQLPAAGVERWVGSLPDGPVVTSMAGAFAQPVAEHALGLVLAGMHRLADAARAREWDDGLRERTRSLEERTVAIVGAGGIGRALIAMLAPLDAHVIAVTRRGHPVDGAQETLAADHTGEALERADVVVLAAPATPGAKPLIGAQELARMRDDAWLVNVGRGTLVDTDALVQALEAGRLGGAALDVTEPEPLPAGHPLWTHPDVLITPHVGTAPEAEIRHAAERIRANVERLAKGEDLLGVVGRGARGEPGRAPRGCAASARNGRQASASASAARGEPSWPRRSSARRRPRSVAGNASRSPRPRMRT
jgi:phosphoglycerate dehydrogenase-like enzyme